MEPSLLAQYGLFGVALTAALPVVERGAVILGVGLGFEPWAVFGAALIGNVLPIIPILIFLELLTERLRAIPAFDRFFEWVFERTRRHGSKLIRRFEWWGLVVLAILGIWTASAAAHLFGFRRGSAFGAIALGATAATLLITLGAIGIIRQIEL